MFYRWIECHFIHCHEWTEFMVLNLILLGVSTKVKVVLAIILFVKLLGQLFSSSPTTWLQCCIIDQHILRIWCWYHRVLSFDFFLNMIVLAVKCLTHLYIFFLYIIFWYFKLEFYQIIWYFFLMSANPIICFKLPVFMYFFSDDFKRQKEDFFARKQDENATRRE